MLCRVPKHGHSAKKFFAECCTRQRNTLGKSGLCRVPRRTRHSEKNYTRQRTSLLSATLGKGSTRQNSRQLPFKETDDVRFAVCQAAALGKPSHFAECQAPGTRQRPSLPSVLPGTRQTIFFYFGPKFFSVALGQYLKLYPKIW